MATAVEMGEVDENLHSRDENIKDGVVTNGEISSKEDTKDDDDSSLKEDETSLKDDSSLKDDTSLKDDNSLKEDNLLKDDDNSLKDDDNSLKDDEISLNDEDMSLKDDEMSLKDDEISIKDDEISVNNDEISVKDDEISLKDDQISIKDDEMSLKDDQISIKDDEISMKDDASLKGDEISSIKDDETSLKGDEKVNEIEIKDDDIELKDNKDDDEDEIMEVGSEDGDDDNGINNGIENVENDNSDIEMTEIPDEQIKEVKDTDKGKDSKDNSKTIELNDSSEADVVIIDDTPKENGQSHSLDNETTVISDDGEDSAPVPSTKTKKLLLSSPRRSSRNVNKRSYVESVKEESEESDVEEIVPEDPLAIQTEPKRNRIPSSTIVVKDTKRLVEIAAKSNPGNSGKKEPTLVIIDTNSILSGRGPVPLVPKPAITSSYQTVLPVAVPAQGVYPPNMRATITPIPMNNSSKTIISQSPSSHQSSQMNQTPPILPSLTDDMFVVEAPSFIVPYVYEKPPLKDFKDFLNDISKEIEEEQKKKKEEERKKKEEEKKRKRSEEGDENDDKIDSEDEEKSSDNDDVIEQPTENVLDDERKSYFDSPLCKFFIDIGYNLVQEYVQTDLLKQQKRKRDREQGQNSQTNNTIKSLLKSLEYSKENNEPYKLEMKRCEFCSFRTESALAMGFHLETPHMKNYVYKCNFCTYEIRSPHDILFHMEAEHAVRGRLERAPAFHQCPNCPFEDNQKGKLSRHLVACMRKYKPEKNLEPPIDWEPPAKIPRAPRMKPTLGNTAALYQMAKTSQYQFMPKMQSNAALNRGRGRPTLGNVKQSPPMIRPNPPMIYKHSMSGGSVLVPANYQMSGNHIYQVVGGQDLGSRISSGSPMALVPNLSAAIQQQQSSSNKKPMHQPSISITPLPRGTSSSSSTSGNSSSSTPQSKPGDSNSKNSFVICEICDGYIKDLEQLRNHMQWIHKVKIHPKMIYNRPPLNCQKCQFRFFTDQGLERHLLGSHGLVTSSMQEAANKSKDSGRCPVCGRVYQWKLLNHVARDHNMTLKPAHLSYKCTVCTATFGMYKLFENHVYSAHSVVAKRVMDKKGGGGSSSSGSPSSVNAKNETLLKPLKINDEITIIPQQPKSSGSASSAAGSSKDSSSTSSGSNHSKNNSVSGPSTSKSIIEEANSALSRAERLARRKSAIDI